MKPLQVGRGQLRRAAGSGQVRAPGGDRSKCTGPLESPAAAALASGLWRVLNSQEDGHPTPSASGWSHKAACSTCNHSSG